MIEKAFYTQLSEEVFFQPIQQSQEYSIILPVLHKQSAGQLKMD